MNTVTVLASDAQHAGGPRGRARAAGCFHKGAFVGIAPTEKPITTTCIEISRIENGKIAE